MADAQDGLPADNIESKKKSWNSRCKQDPRNPNQGFGTQFLGAVHKTTAGSGAHSPNHNPTTGTGGKGIVAW
jgi:hypothetical protein